ncbi:DUF4468 domain-containing protein [Inquilinus sp. KBS0705]|nr:DUF4468 domain-containing protein [Inquilinus sp. KBS0705]
MKKASIFIALIIICFEAKAQKDTLGLNIPIKDESVVYEGIVETPGALQKDLFKNAKQWFVDYFNSSKDVIQNEDKESGRIIGKGIILFIGSS